MNPTFYKSLGRTGLQISRLCLGTMTFGNECDEAEAFKIFQKCRDAGLNMIDTANVYSKGESERITGKLLKDCRDEWVISSKFQGRTGDGPNDRGCSRRHLTRAIDDTLKRLQTDRIEFYFVHNNDPLTPLDETLCALDDLVSQGKILYPAISNSAAWQVVDGLRISERLNLARFECIQPMYNLVKRQVEVELLPMAEAMDLGVLCYSPIAAGLLTGKYQKDSTNSEGRIASNKYYSARYAEEEYTETATRFVSYCTEQGWHPATVAVAWASSHPAVTASIIGGRNAVQIQTALAALNFEMNTVLREEISSLSRTPPLATDRRDEQVGLFLH